MYNYLDFKNDRYRVRERFVRHLNKKTTIEDVGSLLDKFVLDSKAKSEFFNAENIVE
jgi:hypothetical protein